MEMVMKIIGYLSSKIKNFDKYLHLLIGTIVYILVYVPFDPLKAMVAVAIIARWKELFDKKHPDKHSYDGWDAYATLLGAVIGQAILDSPIGIVLQALYTFL